MKRRKRIRLNRSLYRRPGQIYSITTCAADRESVFRDFGLAGECIQALEEVSGHYGIKVYAYCLMPDHVHLLVESSTGGDLARFVAAWKSRCYSICRTRGRKRPMWQRSFHDHALRADEEVRSVAEYIFGNPVRAGLVEDFREYPLSGSLEWDV